MDFVKNHELVVQALGQWPPFHDAKVLDVSRTGDICRASIHVFYRTDRIDARGFFVLEKHHTVDLEFAGVSECSLPDSYDGDILFQLLLEPLKDQFQVVFDSAIDPSHGWKLVCRSIAVTRVAPIEPSS